LHSCPNSAGAGSDTALFSLTPDQPLDTFDKTVRVVVRGPVVHLYRYTAMKNPSVPAHCALREIGNTPHQNTQSGGESDEGRRPAPLGRGPGGGPSPCGSSRASARAFPTTGAARRAVEPLFRAALARWTCCSASTSNCSEGASPRLTVAGFLPPAPGA